MNAFVCREGAGPDGSCSHGGEPGPVDFSFALLEGLCLGKQKTPAWRGRVVELRDGGAVALLDGDQRLGDIERGVFLVIPALVGLHLCDALGAGEHAALAGEVGGDLEGTVQAHGDILLLCITGQGLGYLNFSQPGLLKLEEPRCSFCHNSPNRATAASVLVRAVIFLLYSSVEIPFAA